MMPLSRLHITLGLGTLAARKPDWRNVPASLADMGRRVSLANFGGNPVDWSMHRLGSYNVQPL